MALVISRIRGIGYLLRLVRECHRLRIRHRNDDFHRLVDRNINRLDSELGLGARFGCRWVVVSQEETGEGILKRRSHHRVVTHRALTLAEGKRWNAAANDLLLHAQQIFDLSANFDTAVRDDIAQGLAPIVRAAYDCRANAQYFDDTNTWMAFIDSCTAQWFRDHGFVEWFCVGAATGFNTTPPRTVARNGMDWGGKPKPKLVKKKTGIIYMSTARDAK